MAVQFVSSASGGTGSGTSKTFNFTAAGGADSILIVCVSTYSTKPTSVTFNGDALTEKTSQVNSNNSSAIWYRVSPDSGTYSISITGMGTSTYYVVGAIELSGVDAGNPFDDFESKTIATGTSASMSLTPSIGGTYSVDCISLEAVWSSGLTVGASQTSVYNAKNSSFVYGGMSYESNSGTNDTTMSWTWGGTFGSAGAFSGVLVRAGTIAISKYETITIQELVSGTASVLAQNEWEDIGISENSIGLVSVAVSVFDLVEINDQSTVYAGFVDVLTYETVGLSDDVQLFTPFYTLSVVDSVGTDEDLLGDRDPKQVSVFYQITVNEVIIAGDTKFKDVDNIITVEDIVFGVSLSCSISVYDLIELSDEESAALYFTVNTYSPIGVNDDWIETDTIRWGVGFPRNHPRGSVDLF